MASDDGSGTGKSQYGMFPTVLTNSSVRNCFCNGCELKPNTNNLWQQWNGNFGMTLTGVVICIRAMSIRKFTCVFVLDFDMPSGMFIYLQYSTESNPTEIQN